MKIEITNDGMMVVPETDFETEYLRQYHNSQNIEVKLKFNLSIDDDLEGLMIRIKKQSIPFFIQGKDPQYNIIDQLVNDINH
jgi:hypothetical protein